jgi:hypothetical protein
LEEELDLLQQVLEIEERLDMIVQQQVDSWLD